MEGSEQVLWFANGNNVITGLNFAAFPNKASLWGKNHYHSIYIYNFGFKNSKSSRWIDATLPARPQSFIAHKVHSLSGTTIVGR